ncbi:NAD-dependent epimerase/dehydratase family protein [Nocardioides massiliensis]|uniref:Uronate dehydrogenase n=1 Tax=Nocardioides massiliensis TaxID=1325935 RepID=A0ABT9NP89_9ACTN|nr:NAD(P)-dependent oxidoreductase [Nocardioides massiliensis]MDP9822231.1 uronate dehydrogenase [Nocardioides massiliensis]
MKVLVTGAAGSIGRVLVPGLVDRGHEVVGMDLHVAPDGTTCPWYVADCGDPDAVEATLVDASQAGPVEAVVHLAGIPDETSLDDALASHVLTTGTLLDAMVRHGISRMVYASSNHAVGRTPSSEAVDTRTLPRPDTFYGVGKVAAEALLRLYADRHQIDAVALRIGSFLLQPETRRQLGTWLSHDDAVRMVDAALTTPDPGFAVAYGISNNTRAWWDLEAGRALGYEPEDDAEQFADALQAQPASDDDEVEAAYVGGPFVTEAYYRPARD